MKNNDLENRMQEEMTMTKQELATKIWESANKMRSKIEANDYKDYILGFIFYKYLSYKEEKFMLNEGMPREEFKNELNENDKEIMNHIQENLGYFISYDNLFSTWLKKGKDFDVDNVRVALSAFSRLIHTGYKKVFDGIFNTLETGLSKLGDTSGKQTKAISDLINLINDIPMNGKQDYDVLGFIYEYLISQFAANAGKKAGEFYTPHEVSLLMSEIVAHHLKEKEKIELYDPTSGSGSLLINIGESMSKYMADPNGIKYFAQELKQNTYNLTRMNLIMRGILPSNIVTRNGDTLEDDWPYFEGEDKTSYERLYVDAVVSNPPYSQAWDPTDKEIDPRYSRFGLAPKGKADYAFLLHDLYHVKPTGIMTIVLPHGVLFRGGEEGTIRKNLIENNNIDAIIGLPANIFFGTGIPTIIIVLKQQRENSDVLIIDASKGFVKEGKNNKLRSSDIKRIADTVQKRISIDKYSKVVSKEEIRENDYNLNIPRYVDSSEKPESYDIYATMFGGVPKSEIAELKEFWEEFPNLKKDLFIEKGQDHMDVKCDDIREMIINHSDTKEFLDKFYGSFEGFDKEFISLVIDKIERGEKVNSSKTEEVLTEEIFRRFEKINLIDKYKAYQILDDEWNIIGADLEMISREGIEVTKKVKPNVTIKKNKNGNETMIQNGWIGRILPFELVQENILVDESSALKEKEEELSRVVEEQKEIFESFTEDDKEEIKDVLNDNGDAFLSAPLTKKVKELLKENKKKSYDEESVEYKVIASKELNEKEKKLKKEIKNDSEKLHALTKETIENLSDEDMRYLLIQKWVEPVIKGLSELPNNMVDTLVEKVESLQKKYDETFEDIENEIKDVEKELTLMIGELTGNESDMMGLNEFKKLLGGM